MLLPSHAIIKISFRDLGRMVAQARWENQALMGYIKKYGSHWTGFPSTKPRPPPPPPEDQDN